MSQACSRELGRRAGPRPGRLRLLLPHVFRLLILLALSAIVLVVALTTHVFDEISPDRVRAWVRRVGVWAPAAYLAGFIVRPLTLVPLTPWLFAGGIAFGWLWGALYALAGVNAGAAAEFMAARALGREFVEKLLVKRGRGLRRAPKVWNTRFVLSIQLLPFMPHDLINTAAGCSMISYRRFLAGSSLGTLPFILLYTYAGSVLMAPGSRRFYAAFLALGVLVLASIAASRRLRPAEEAAGEREEVTPHAPEVRLLPSAREGGRP